jgi:hypothetical protein
MMLPVKTVLGRVALVVGCVLAIASSQAQSVNLGPPDIVEAESYSSIGAAISALGSATKTLRITTPMRVATSVRVPSNIALWFAGAGRIAIPCGRTLFIAGPLESALRQIFAACPDSLPIASMSPGRANGRDTLIRVKTTTPHGLSDSSAVSIHGVHSGTVEANGVWVAKVVGPTEFDLLNSRYQHPYSSGGRVRSVGVLLSSAPNTWGSSRAGTAAPEWWGINGALPPYDDLAVQSAIDTHRPVLFNNDYHVATVHFNGSEFFVDFSRFKLVGRSRGAFTAVLELNAYNSVLRNAHVDANFNAGYGAAVLWYSDSNRAAGGDIVDGLYIENTLVGLAFGALPGAPPGINTAQSESTIHGFLTRGTERPLYFNQPNGRLYLVAPQLLVTRNEWDPAVFSYARSYCLHQASRGGGLVVLGGQCLNSESALGVGVRGSHFQLINTSLEVKGAHVIEGDDVTITGNENVGGHDRSAFVIDSGSKGRLLLVGLRLARSDGQAMQGSPFIDCSRAPQFSVELASVEVTNWRWSYVGESIPLVKGCNSVIRGLRLQTTSPAATLDVDDSGPRRAQFSTADVVGITMPTDQNQLAKGGWSWNAPAGGSNWFAGGISDAPPNYPGSIALSSASRQSAAIISPTGVSGFPVVPNATTVFRCWAKTSTSGLAAIDVYWYRFDGNPASIPATAILKWDLGVPGQQSVSWSEIVAPLKVPGDAAFAAIRLYTDNTGILKVTGLRF